MKVARVYPAGVKVAREEERRKHRKRERERERERESEGELVHTIPFKSDN